METVGRVRGPCVDLGIIQWR